MPILLERWYLERKDMQKELKRVKDNGTADEVEYWDKRQLVKKINLNSLYGAILNPVVDPMTSLQDKAQRLQDAV